MIQARLQLDDEGGVYHQRSAEILAGLRAVGYQSNDTDMWHKNQFCPMWRFLVHTLLQCMSNKSGGWDQFSTQLGCGIMCLSQGLTYNFSRFIFDNMLENLFGKKHKFLMYPRFLQMILNIRTRNTIFCPVSKLSAKLFASMKTHYEGAHHPLTAEMLPQGNVDVEEADAAEGGQPPSPHAADGEQPPSPSVAPDGNPLVDTNE